MHGSFSHSMPPEMHGSFSHSMPPPMHGSFSMSGHYDMHGSFSHSMPPPMHGSFSMSGHYDMHGSFSHSMPPPMHGSFSMSMPPHPPLPGLAGPLPLSVGERVSAKWKGGYVCYPGAVTALNAGGTYAVQFDDGDFEPEEAPHDFCPPVAPPHPIPEPGVGARVSARWKGGSFCYAGMITMANEDGSFAIQFDDGDFEEAEPPSDFCPPINPLGGPTRVSAKWKGSETCYPGIIEAENADGTYAVLFDDGDYEPSEAPHDFCPPMDPAPPPMHGSLSMSGPPPMHGSFSHSMPPEMHGSFSHSMPPPMHGSFSMSGSHMHGSFSMSGHPEMHGSLSMSMIHGSLSMSHPPA